MGIADTTVLVHYFRGDHAARSWIASQRTQLSIVTLSWMELMSGTTNKAHQASCQRILGHFELLYLTSDDQRWAMFQLERFQFSHHIGINDCLIASVAYRLRVPLFTHNLKHIVPLIGDLALQPY